jgi:hypothetical protein
VAVRRVAVRRVSGCEAGGWVNVRRADVRRACGWEEFFDSLSLLLYPQLVDKNQGKMKKVSPFVEWTF